MYTLEQKLQQSQDDIDYRYVSETLYSLMDDMYVVLDLIGSVRNNRSGVLATLERNHIYVEDDSESALLALLGESDDDDSERGFFGKIWDAIKRMFAAIGNFFKRIFGRGKDEEVDAPRSAKSLIDKKLREEVAGITTTLKKKDATVKALDATAVLFKVVTALKLDAPASITSESTKITIPGVLDLDISDQTNAVLKWDTKLSDGCTVVGIKLPTSVSGGIKHRWVFRSTFEPADDSEAILLDRSVLFHEEAKPVTECGITSAKDLEDLRTRVNQVKKLYPGMDRTMMKINKSLPKQVEQQLKSSVKSKDKEQAKLLMSYSGFVTTLLMALVKTTTDVETAVSNAVLFIGKQLDTKDTKKED